MKPIFKSCLTLATFLLPTLAIGQTGTRILFDATRAEMASNADWVVDADAHNLGNGTGGIMTVGRGSESNPQRIPTPAQSTFSNVTTETVWSGALSSWGLTCARQGLTVETLPVGGRITYQEATNDQDLSRYAVYVLDEPNIRFSAPEKIAILQWVAAGGGLFLISDHNNSDRNNDGFDSPAVLNDLLTTNAVAANPFGFTYELTYFSEISSNYAPYAGSAILNGTAGRPRFLQISGGASMVLDTVANRSVRALIFRNGYTLTGSTGALLCQARYGAGRVVGMTDSSPMDDGTGDPGDQLYTGWAEQGGDHARLLTNATRWLAGLSDDTLATPLAVKKDINTAFRLPELSFYPSPARGPFSVICREPIASLTITSAEGHTVLVQTPAQGQAIIIAGGFLSPGAYLVTATGTSGRLYRSRLILAR